MTLQTPNSAAEIGRQRDRMLKLAQDDMQDGASEAIRYLLDRMRGSVRESLTAAAQPPLPRMTSDFFTLGQVREWWEEGIDEHLVQRVAGLYAAGRASSTDLPASARSLDASGEYLGRVRDRLSRTAQPPIWEEAFNTARVALAQETARGSGINEISRRLGAELQWTGQDVGFWTDRRDSAASAIDSILDRVGPPGDPVREAMRLNDPEVRELQAARTEAQLRLDRDQSQWQVRAERIARTETTGAFNAGAEAAYLEEGAGAKIWVATADERTRETHLDAHGQCVPVGEVFAVGSGTLTYPGDPSGPAEEVINCRCTTVAAATCGELARISEPADRVIGEEQTRRDEQEARRERTFVERALDG
jgi:hypothetical protein